GCAAVEENGVAILNPLGGCLGDESLLLELTLGSLFQGRQTGSFTDKHCPAVDSLDQSLPIPVVQIAPQRRFGNLHGLSQVSQGHEPSLTEKIQHTLPALLKQHTNDPER